VEREALAALELTQGSLADQEVEDLVSLDLRLVQAHLDRGATEVQGLRAVAAEAAALVL
jgi:hypothetical protein